MNSVCYDIEPLPGGVKPYNRVDDMSYDDLKEYKGRKYSGMPVGGSHLWDYRDSVWKEKKEAPDLWSFEFSARKRRHDPAPSDSGAGEGSRYHWYIIADQRARKVDKDSYETVMYGSKFKVGHRRPYWKKWSYEYPDQGSYRKMVISILERKLAELKAMDR